MSEANSLMVLMFNGKLEQRRYYGAEGRPIVDIDYFHNGIYHEFPHKHIWLDNLPNRRSGH